MTATKALLRAAFAASPEGRRALLLVLGMGAAAAGVLLAAGCGPRARLQDGCNRGDEVPRQVREQVLSAAEAFYTRLHAGDWKAIYENAAGAVQRQRSPQEFIGPIARVAGQLGVPGNLATQSLDVIRFGPNFPHAARVSCTAAGDARPTVYLLTDHPLQASLVQTGEQAGETFYYSTLWYGGDDGTWKLAAFFAKPATVYGKDWKGYESEASDQKLAAHLRNAALLYNVAIDLAVPAAWVKPASVDELQREQRRISVDRLPGGRVDAWPAPPDTFKVFTVGYTIREGGLGLIFRYQTPAAPADSAAQAAYGKKLLAYIEREFPEYPAVFHSVTLQAASPGDRKLQWYGTYPLPAGSSGTEAGR